jgi:multiple sugar transport system permease protein
VRIALPLSKPALTTVGIYAFLDAWSDYLAPMIYISKPDKLTLSLGMQQFLSQYSVDWALLMAAALIFVFPVIVFFLFFQRYFVQGISTSGLKA